ncbi:facilitated trehalose transporter Tret1 [Cherax quadricarinatus]
MCALQPGHSPGRVNTQKTEAQYPKGPPRRLKTRENKARELGNSPKHLKTEKNGVKNTKNSPGSLKTQENEVQKPRNSPSHLKMQENEAQEPRNSPSHLRMQENEAQEARNSPKHLKKQENNTQVPENSPKNLKTQENEAQETSNSPKHLRMQEMNPLLSRHSSMHLEIPETEPLQVRHSHENLQTQKSDPLQLGTSPEILMIEEVEQGESSESKKKRIWRQLGKVMQVSLGTCMIGTLFTFPSVIAADLYAHHTTIYGTNISIDGLEDMVGSLVMLGSLPGAWVTASLDLQLRRRKAMIVHGVLAVLGWLGVALLPSVVGVLISRCVSGVAMGGFAVVLNAYVTELVDDEVRGMMSMVLNLGIMKGQLLTVCLGYAARYYVVALINTLVPVFFLIFLIWLPESPALLVLKGKEEQARKILLNLRGKHADLSTEMQKYQDLNPAISKRVRWRSLTHSDHFRSLAVVCTLLLINTFSGYMVLNANSFQIFKSSGSTVEAKLCTIVLMIVQGTMLGKYEETLLTLESVTARAQVVRRGGWMPLACLVVSQTGVVLGVNFMPLILTQEYFSTILRSQASSICVTVWILGNFAVLQLYTPMMVSLTQAGLYGFYASVCLLGIVFTAFFVRETMGEKVG